MGEVRQRLEQQQKKLNDSMDKVENVRNGIVITKNGTNEINTQAESCDKARIKVMDVIQSLSAVSEENAATSEETTASMQELNSNINLLAQSATDLKELAVLLQKNTEFFQI